MNRGLRGRRKRYRSCSTRETGSSNCVNSSVGLVLGLVLSVLSWVIIDETGECEGNVEDASTFSPKTFLRASIYPNVILSQRSVPNIPSNLLVTCQSADIASPRQRGVVPKRKSSSSSSGGSCLWPDRCTSAFSSLSLSLSLSSSVTHFFASL